MKKSFTLGIAIGAVAAAAYGMGRKVKESMAEGKQKIKDKINDMMD